MARRSVLFAYVGRLLPPLAVLGVGLALFAGTLQNPFIGDDVLIAVQNPYPSHLANIPRYFSSDTDWLIAEDIPGLPDQPSRFGMYRPILLTTFAIDTHLSGQDPFEWRLTNLVLHLFAALLVLGLAGRLLGSRLGALAAALLFAAHPIHTEAVATLIGGRSELLAGIFVLASWWVHLAGDERHGGRRWLTDVGSACLFALGLLSKENAVVLPAIIFLAGWTLRGHITKNLLVRLIPHLAVFVLYVVVRLVLIGRVAPADWSVAFGDAGPGWIALSILLIQATYLRLVLLPYPLQFQMCYQGIPASASGFTAVAAALLVLGLIGIAAWCAVRARKSGRPSFWAFGLLLFYLCLVPVSHLIPHWVVMAERFLYLPSVALCLVVGWLAVRAHAYRRWILLAAGLPLLAACALGTLSRNADWADLDRFWTRTARCAPDAFEPYDAMGNARLRQGRPAEAIPFLEKAAEIAPSNSFPLYNLGVALQRLGRNREAERAYRKALDLEPNHAMAMLNLGTLLEARGDLAGAKQHYRRAIRGDPTHPAPFVNLGNLLQREGRYQEAEKLFRLALRVAPRLVEARFNLARLLTPTERKNEAESLYLEIIEDHPDHAMAHNNLANIKKDRGQTEEAESLYQKALRADPDCGPAHYNLANLLLSRGDPAGAADHYTRTLALQPDKLEALIGLAHARARLGQLALAEKAARKAADLAPEDRRVRKLLDALRQAPR